MIALKNISYQYQNSTKEQLKDISLDIKTGEFILLTGKSGCGKTTLTRILNGLCPKFFEGKLQGQYFLDGQNTDTWTISEIGQVIGSVFQDPRSQFFTLNTTDEIVLGMENHEVPREKQKERLIDIAAQIGVENLLNRNLFPLSSGEKQRIAIASACAIAPKVLVLDEPSANLDADAIKRLSQLLYRLKASGTTIVLSEHRLHYVEALFDRMLWMEEGRIKSECTREAALSLSNESLHQMGLRLFKPPRIVPDKRVTPKEVCKLKAEQIAISFDGHKVLDDIDLSLESGEILAIMGGNGAGKTTLCRVITGLKQQNVGQVHIDSKPTKKKRRLRNVFFVQQDSDYQLYAPSIEDEFRIGRSKKEMTQEAILTLLKGVGLDQDLEKHPLALSGGQKQRLLLALAASSQQDILVLDEPTSGLDGHNMRLTADYLKQLASKGHSIIMITHDVELIALAADSLIYIDKGAVKYHRTFEINYESS